MYFVVNINSMLEDFLCVVYFKFPSKVLAFHEHSFMLFFCSIGGSAGQKMKEVNSLRILDTPFSKVVSHRKAVSEFTNERDARMWLALVNY